MSAPLPEDLSRLCADLVHAMTPETFLPLPVLWEGRPIGKVVYLSHGHGFAHITDPEVCEFMQKLRVSRNGEEARYEGHDFSY